MLPLLTLESLKDMKSFKYHNISNKYLLKKKNRFLALGSTQMQQSIRQKNVIPNQNVKSNNTE